MAQKVCISMKPVYDKAYKPLQETLHNQAHLDIQHHPALSQCYFYIQQEDMSSTMNKTN